MGFTGLKQFKQQEEARQTKSESPYFKLQQGQKVKIRPLAELDEDGKNFDGKHQANFVREYTNPVKFWLSIVDTYDKDTGEKCVGGELVQKFGWFKKDNPDPEKNQHNDKTKNWNPKVRYYLPVLVDRLDDSEPTVEVLQCSYGDKSPFKPFVDFYENKGTITDRWWDYSRNGKPGVKQEMREVVYTLTPDDPSKLDIKKIDIPDVNDAPYVNNVPYEDQAAFLQLEQTYGSKTSVTSDSTGNSTGPHVSVSATKSSDDSEDW